jgi:hypothetical protein
MTDYLSKYPASSLFMSPVTKSSSDCSCKICHEEWILLIAWYIFYTILCGNCPLGSVFPIDISLWILDNWSNIQCASSPFEVYWRWWSPQFCHTCEEKRLNHGIRNQLILRRLWYIFYTILLHIFSDLIAISNWMLLLEYWRARYGSHMKRHLKVFKAQ